MKLKYYLRGLGIGIVVTAIIMSFTGKPEELTNAEIKIRAAQLGMVEKNVLSDIQKENESSEEIMKENDVVEDVPEADNELNAENTQDVIENTEEMVSNATEENENIEETISDTENQNQETGNSETDVSVDEVVENYIIIQVENGNGSEVISQRVFEAGLVNSAKEYNKYLITNGYDRRLRTGNHEIPAGASEEEIAKILCGMR
ncbi:MAG: hypothetical protein IKY94_16195 [Lachnospiraceae bacterium]|nr:hypothetical protein [Lachnospiraceae bacterium]